jgi:hypothetical protein
MIVPIGLSGYSKDDFPLYVITFNGAQAAAVQAVLVGTNYIYLVVRCEFLNPFDQLTVYRMLENDNVPGFYAAQYSRQAGDNDEVAFLVIREHTFAGNPKYLEHKKSEWRDSLHSPGSKV